MIATQELSKAYCTKDESISVLSEVNMRVDKGSFIAIMGKSGAGKSTLLYLLASFLNPDSGKIIFGDRNYSELSDRELSELRGKEIGFLFQDSNLLEGYSILDNVALSACLYMSLKDAKERARILLDRVELSERINHLPQELSGGECQRAGLARALVNNPRVLFLDEPTGSVDMITSEALLKLFEKLHQEGLTIIMVTHDAEVASRAEVVYFLKDGILEKSCELGRYNEAHHKERLEQILDLYRVI